MSADSILMFTAVIFSALAAGLVGYLLLTARPVRVPIERRRPGHVAPPSALQRGAERATELIVQLQQRRGAPEGASLLELDAIRMRPQNFVMLTITGAVVGGIVGILLGNVFVAILLALVAPVWSRALLGIRIKKRQQRFADQLEDALQLMASGLRAGHSLPQTLASVAKEAEEPIAEEFARVVNETRLGRDLVVALELTAARMDSDDFAWITQAIAINREVGGNLADVLDGVADTIRQRNEVRRQVATLSAEGRLSARILMGLPFAIGGFLLLTNPGYLEPLISSPLGYGLLIIGALMLLIGGLWLKKTVEIEF